MDTLKDLLKDRGLYQIYGHHPVYGSNVLLYIGQTYGRTFGERIEEHNFGGGSQEDRAHIYIGQTYGRTFGERIEEHNFGGGSQEDRAHIYIGQTYGRTFGERIEEHNF